MKVEHIINLYNDEGKKLTIGDVVYIKTLKMEYKGTIKTIGSKGLKIKIDQKNSCLILLYSRIIKLI